MFYGNNRTCVTQVLQTILNHLRYTEQALNYAINNALVTKIEDREAVHGEWTDKIQAPSNSHPAMISADKSEAERQEWTHLYHDSSCPGSMEQNTLRAPWLM